MLFLFDSFTCLEVIINQTGVLFFGTPGSVHMYQCINEL